jgi:Cu(I)/Ag(I) efflux system membrane protein CusA/SilA
MIRDEDGALTGYVYLNLNTHDYGGFVQRAEKLLSEKLTLPAGYTWRWAGEYEFEMRAKQRLGMILPIVFFVIFLLLYLSLSPRWKRRCLSFPRSMPCQAGCCCSGR